jgi:hypothetical protein
MVYFAIFLFHFAIWGGAFWLGLKYVGRPAARWFGRPDPMVGNWKWFAIAVSALFMSFPYRVVFLTSEPKPVERAPVQQQTTATKRWQLYRSDLRPGYAVPVNEYDVYTSSRECEWARGLTMKKIPADKLFCLVEVDEAADLPAPLRNR